MKRMMCIQLTAQELANMLKEKGVLKADEFLSVEISTPCYGTIKLAGQADTVVVEMRWEDPR